MVDGVVPVEVRPPQLIVARVIEKQTAEVELRLLVGDPSGPDVVFVVGQQQLVELAAGRTAVVETAQHAEVAHPLDRLAHGLRNTVGHAEIDFRHFGKVPA